MRGGNVVDTADIYTNGHSEKIVGDFFAARPGLRERVVLSTKFFASLHPGDPNGGGAGRKALIAQLEESLQRLQTDYVDLYWLHGWDRRAPIEETLRALDGLVAAGKVRYAGFSDVPRGSPRRPRRSRTSAAGRRSPRCSSSTRSSSARPKASCCRWPKRSAWASCLGGYCRNQLGISCCEAQPAPWPSRIMLSYRPATPRTDLRIKRRLGHDGDRPNPSVFSALAATLRSPDVPPSEVVRRRCCSNCFSASIALVRVSSYLKIRFGATL
jgi:hypothetical protein